MHALKQIAQQDQLSPDVASLICTRLAHTKNSNAFFGIETALEFNPAYFGADGGAGLVIGRRGFTGASYQRVVSGKPATLNRQPFSPMDSLC